MGSPRNLLFWKYTPVILKYIATWVREDFSIFLIFVPRLFAAETSRDDLFADPEALLTKSSRSRARRILTLLQGHEFNARRVERCGGGGVVRGATSTPRACAAPIVITSAPRLLNAHVPRRPTSGRSNPTSDRHADVAGGRHGWR